MVSPGTRLAKIHESQSRTNESQLKKKNQTNQSGLKMLGPLCNQTVKLKRDSKTLNYSIQYNIPSVLKHNKG